MWRFQYNSKVTSTILLFQTLPQEKMGPKMAKFWATFISVISYKKYDIASLPVKKCDRASRAYLICLF